MADIEIENSQIFTIILVLAFEKSNFLYQNNLLFDYSNFNY